MDVIAGVFIGEGYVPLIPVWFYLFSLIAYGASALISLMVSYFSMRIYLSDRKMKPNLFLSIAFLGMGVAYAVLTFTSVYTYLHEPYFRGFLSLNLVNSNGFSIYYAVTIASYILLNVAYLPKKLMKKVGLAPTLFVPLYFINSMAFHVASIALLLIVNLRTIRNFMKKSSVSSALVMLCFLSVLVSHALLFSISFDITFYLLAHAILTFGFVMLLITLIRVNKDAEAKK
jgi:hypothetical protein